MDKNLEQYLATALWSTMDESTPNGGEPMDRNYSVEDFSKEAIDQSQEDWDSFVKQAGNLLDDLDLTDVAHDFWLTRNHHGAGFWDGDWGDELGKKLTDLAHSFSEVNLYIENEKIYIS